MPLPMSTTYVTQKTLLFPKMYPFPNLISIPSRISHASTHHSQRHYPAIWTLYPKRNPKRVIICSAELVTADTWLHEFPRSSYRRPKRRRSLLSSRLDPRVVIEWAFGPQFPTKTGHALSVCSCVRAIPPGCTRQSVLMKKARKIHKKDKFTIS